MKKEFPMDISNTIKDVENGLKVLKRNRDTNKKENSHYDNLYKLKYSGDSLNERRFLNVGAGQFKHKYWSIADRLYEDGKRWSEKEADAAPKSQIDYYYDFMDREPFEIEDNSIEIVYTSHALEHVFNDDIEFFLMEAYRILKPGGTLRIVVPSAELAKIALENKDRSYFIRLSEKSTLEAGVARHLSLCGTKHGQSLMSEQEIVGLFKERSFYEACDVLYEKSHTMRTNTNGRHVNWFTYDKVSTMVTDAKFVNVCRSGYRQSIEPVLRDVRYFDSTRPEMSLFVEGKKPVG